MCIRDRVITRVWEATDDSGNTASCTQVISRERATLADVVFPANFTTDCSNNENDLLPNGTLVSGEPTGAECSNLVVSSLDEIVPICAGTYKVLRHWTVTDWCAPVGGNVITATQIVKIEDTTGPNVDAVADQTLGTNSAGCNGVFVAPFLSVTDDCSGTVSYTHLTLPTICSV